jgi:Kef-type K+ transport system membrane component KefB
MEVSNKNILTVLLEATVVGSLLILLVKFVRNYLLQYIPDISGDKSSIEAIFLAGFLFHLIFEYTGLNLWYSKEYCKLLKLSISSRLAVL